MRGGDQNSIETEVAVTLAEKYLVRAEYELGSDATADKLFNEAIREMKVALSSTISKELAPAAQFITSELEKLIRRFVYGQG